MSASYASSNAVNAPVSRARLAAGVMALRVIAALHSGHTGRAASDAAMHALVIKNRARAHPPRRRFTHISTRTSFPAIRATAPY